MKRKLHTQIGFTLVELVIVVAIISILGALAIPAYDRYTRKTSRAAAKTAIEQVRGLMESYYINNKSFTNDLTKLGFGASPATINKSGNEVAAAASDAAYQISVALAGGGYTISAAPQNDQANDTECATLNMNSLGQKNATGAKGPACW